MDDIKKGAKNALRYVKKRGIITDAIDEGEKFFVSKATKPEHIDLIKQVRKTIKTKYGVGIKSSKPKRFAKGSQEAKDRMAKLRAMRKKPMAAGSFRL